MKLWNNFWLIAVACLTLGLAPFVPEPHVWEKVRWLFTGTGPGWEPIYIFDFFLHGWPWVLLIRLGIIKVIQLIKGPKQVTEG